MLAIKNELPWNEEDLVSLKLFALPLELSINVIKKTWPTPASVKEYIIAQKLSPHWKKFLRSPFVVSSLWRLWFPQCNFPPWVVIPQDKITDYFTFTRFFLYFVYTTISRIGLGLPYWSNYQPFVNDVLPIFLISSPQTLSSTNNHIDHQQQDDSNLHSPQLSPIMNLNTVFNKKFCSNGLIISARDSKYYLRHCLLPEGNVFCSLFPNLSTNDNIPQSCLTASKTMAAYLDHSGVLHHTWFLSNIVNNNCTSQESLVRLLPNNTGLSDLNPAYTILKAFDTFLILIYASLLDNKIYISVYTPPPLNSNNDIITQSQSLVLDSFFHTHQNKGSLVTSYIMDSSQLFDDSFSPDMLIYSPYNNFIIFTTASSDTTSIIYVYKYHLNSDSPSVKTEISLIKSLTASGSMLASSVSPFKGTHYLTSWMNLFWFSPEHNPLYSSDQNRYIFYLDGDGRKFSILDLESLSIINWCLTSITVLDKMVSCEENNSVVESLLDLVKSSLGNKFLLFSKEWDYSDEPEDVINNTNNNEIGSDLESISSNDSSSSRSSFPDDELSMLNITELNFNNPNIVDARIKLFSKVDL